MEAAKVGMTDHNILAVAMESPSVTARQKGKAYQFIGGVQPTWLR